MANETRDALGGILATIAALTLNQVNTVLACGVALCALIIGIPKAADSIRHRWPRFLKYFRR